MVYIGSSDDNLYAFSATCRSGCQPLWTYPTDGAIISSPTVANGVLYVGSTDHYLYAFNTNCVKNCGPIWRYKAQDKILASPVVINGMIYVAWLGALHVFGFDR